MENQAPEKPSHPLFFHRGTGLQPGEKLKKILPGQRLFIVENLRKAHRIKNIFPEDEVISTGGIPFEITLKLPKEGEQISFRTNLSNEKGKKLAEEIVQKAENAEVVVLLTDTSARGEAVANGLFEEIPQIQRKAYRVLTKSLERESLQQAITQEELLPPADRTQCRKAKAMGYWVRAVMDITWKNKISPWVAEATKIVRQVCGETPGQKNLESLTRLQCSILHILSNQEASQQNYRGYKYWEVEAILSGSTPGSMIEASISVPNLLQLENGGSRVTRKIWEDKLTENLKRVREGCGIPQKEPGHPWRFETENEASLYRHHLKRYPLLTVQSIESWTEEQEPEPCHTTSTLLEKALQLGWGKQKEIADVLEDLYLAGLISHPKTGTGNLSEKTFQAMWKAAAQRQQKLLHQRRKFDETDSTQEGIHPTRWEKTPEKTEAEIIRSTKPPKVELAKHIYQEIYNRAWDSQSPAKNIPVLQISVTGPLHVTAEEAFKGNASAKENMFSALMNLVMTGTVFNCEKINPLYELKKHSVMQAIRIRIQAKETRNPQELDRERLLLTMQKLGMGKLETLSNLIPKLEEVGMLEETPQGIKLKEAGKITINLLNEHLGGYIHQKYHEVVEAQLRNIEKGNTDPLQFLQYWWQTLCDAADRLPPIPEAVADSSGRSLQDIEKTLAKERNTPAPSFDLEKTA